MAHVLHINASVRESRVAPKLIHCVLKTISFLQISFLELIIAAHKLLAYRSIPIKYYRLVIYSDLIRSLFV